MDEEADMIAEVMKTRKGMFHQKIRTRKIKEILTHKRKQIRLVGNISQHEDEIQCNLEPLKQFSNLENRELIQWIQLARRKIEQNKFTLGNDNAEQFNVFLKMSFGCEDIKNDPQILQDILFICIDQTSMQRQYQSRELCERLSIELLKKKPEQYDNYLDYIINNDFKMIDQLIIIEQLVIILNNLVLEQNQVIFKQVIRQNSFFSKLISLFSEQYGNYETDLIQLEDIFKRIEEEIVHLIYNISQQTQLYKFSEILDLLTLIDLLFPKCNSQQLQTMLIKSMSLMLNIASQQKFEMFVLSNLILFNNFSLFIKQNFVQNKLTIDRSQTIFQSTSEEAIHNSYIQFELEDTVRCILEFYLMTSEILGEKDQCEIRQLQKQIIQSALIIFKKESLDQETIILVLKIIQSVLQSLSQRENIMQYLLYNQQQGRIEKDIVLYNSQPIYNTNPICKSIYENHIENETLSPLIMIIEKCCSFQDQDIANEFLLVLCTIMENVESVQQIQQIFRSGVIYILLESLKQGFIHPEVRHKILEQFIALTRLNVTLYREEESLILNLIQIIFKQIIRYGGREVFYQFAYNNQLSLKEQQLIDSILDFLNKKVI